MTTIQRTRTRTVSAREANQRFSKLLSEVAAGAEVVITRRGTPVAKLSPVDAAAYEARRQEAIERMMKRLETGVRLGGIKVDRDEIYDR